MIKKLINKLKNKKVGMALIILIVITFSFYWYEVRPSNIKKECSIVAIEKAIEKRKKAGKTDEEYLQADRDIYYNWCLQTKGL